MKKTASTVMTVVISLVIVILSLMCVVSCPVPYFGYGIPQEYNSVVSVINKGADLSGGYTATYYPEGIISAKEFDSSVKQYKAIYTAAEQSGSAVQQESVRQQWKEYAEKYVAWTGSAVETVSEELPESAANNAVMYMEKNTVCEKNGSSWSVTDDFKADFDNAVNVMTMRFDKKNLSGLSVAKVNGYSIRVDVPYTVSDYETLFNQMGYGGDFYLKGASSERVLLPKTNNLISKYVKSASSGASGETGYVTIEMTSEGREELKTITSTIAADTENQVLYFNVGDNQLISLTVTEELDNRTLAISGSYTPETAENVGIIIQSCIEQGGIALTLKADVSEISVESTDSVMLAIYIIIGVAILAMAIFSIVRYRGLGVAHVFGYLSYLICMLMFIAFLPDMVLSSGGLLALLLTSVLCVCTNYYVYEAVRKEFDNGKTLDSAIKDGYKRTAAGVWDTHILLLVMSIVLFFISVGEMVPFAHIFGLGVLMSGIVVLLTRFYWYCMRGLLDRSQQYKFCGFKREVNFDDDED